MARISPFFFLLVLLVLTIHLHESEGHGRLMRPPSRSSVWRIQEFQNKNPPPNYTDNELFCGGIHQVDNPGSNCGVCGDPLSKPRPRENEFGGYYYRGIITGKYSSGQTIDVEVELTASHLGFMEWRLCPNARTEMQDCFKYLLQRADGQGSRLLVDKTGTYRTRLTLPAGLKCEQCVIQWNYRAGNNWGNCGNGTSAVGCGPQETFRGCADVSIQ